MTEEEASEKAVALLSLLESDFGQSGRDVRLLAIRDELISVSRGHTGEVPGYVRVPREPTQAMIEAAAREDIYNWDQWMPAKHYLALYKAMLAALEDGEP